MQVAFNRLEKHRSFRSTKHFASFAEKQVTAFEEIENSSPDDASVWASQMKNAWQSAKNTADSHPDNEAQIVTHLAQQPVTTHNSPLAAHFRRLTKSGQSQLVSGMITSLTLQFVRSHPQQYSSQVWLGAIEATSVVAVATRLDHKSTQRTVSALIDDCEERIDALLQDDLQDLTEKQEKFQALIDQSEAKREAMVTLADRNMREQAARWEKTHLDYIEELKTKTAVDLWEKRAEGHEEKYKNFRKLSLICGGIGAVVVFLWLLFGFHAASWAVEAKATGSLAVYSAGSIVLFTILIWMLRVLVRSMMSENHLATDASVRSAMAHTYLALTKEDAATDSDRSIVLASLFAPVADGIVSDDGMPLFSPAALAANAITNPKPS